MEESVKFTSLIRKIYPLQERDSFHKGVLSGRNRRREQSEPRRTATCDSCLPKYPGFVKYFICTIFFSPGRIFFHFAPCLSQRGG